MNYRAEIAAYQPVNEQETTDKRMILERIGQEGDRILRRECDYAHITSSAVILNQDRTKMLMIHHNIYNTWTWTGGHADGQADLLAVALKEATEETGMEEFRVLGGIQSLDVLYVPKHIKHGVYVAPHLHLNVAYVFEADDRQQLVLNQAETSNIQWIDLKEVPAFSGEADIIYIYNKMLKKVESKK